MIVGVLMYKTFEHLSYFRTLDPSTVFSSVELTLILLMANLTNIK